MGYVNHSDHTIILLIVILAKLKGSLKNHSKVKQNKVKELTEKDLYVEMVHDNKNILVK